MATPMLWSNLAVLIVLAAGLLGLATAASATAASATGGSAESNDFSCSVTQSNPNLLATWQVEWPDQGQSTYYVRQQIQGRDLYLGSATGRTIPVSNTQGSFVVRYWPAGSNTFAEASCLGTGEPGDFTCVHHEDSLFWSNQRADIYHVSAVVDGNRRYVRSTPSRETGVSAFRILVGEPDEYIVRHWVGGSLFEAVCPHNPPSPTFECRVFGSTLSWSDDGSNPYSVLAVNDGVETFLRTSGGNSTRIIGVDERYIVRHFGTGSRVETSCAGGTFECEVSGSQLTWDDQRGVRYHVRAINGGTETYLGSASDAAPYLQVSGTDDSYIVRYWLGPRSADAMCAPDN